MIVHPSSSSARGAVGGGSPDHRDPTLGSSRLNSRLDVIDAYTAAWETGESPDLRAFLSRLDPSDSEGRVELVYRDFCLVEASGGAPIASDYLARFPDLDGSLGRLLELHAECPASLLERLVDPQEGGPEWPEGGDWIGAYLIKRELGRGAFARVYLAEQVDLENRLIVIKLTTRPSEEAHLLARARHENIVEVESQEPVNDGVFQLIRMPFWGGATLAAVLEARRARVEPSTGRDLLDDLDSVAASEYPSVQTARPAREILERLSYGQAIAWLIARLAAALDHAYRKAVIHGDVKPSNIILTDNGTPMLLDFNLARDGSRVVPEGGSSELGGTLAYMAPERLARLAHQPGSSAMADSSADFDAHRADVYSLGMVLLEALTGRLPEITPARSTRPGIAGPAAPRRASDWAKARQISAADLIRHATQGGRSIPRGLRSILERCLDLDPSRRYHHARELADDLDRWRTNRAPAFATDSLMGDRVPRFIRRQKRMLTAASITIVVGLTAAVLVARLVSLQALSDRAQQKMGWYIGDLQGGAYGFQRPGERLGLNLLGAGLGRSDSIAKRDRRVVDIAQRALKDYELLGVGDWRERDDVRLLPDADRKDVELWLLEQAYRYCRALAARVDSPADWERALSILDQVSKGVSIEAYDLLARSLETKLVGIGKGGPDRLPAKIPGQADHDLYLMGVASEYDARDDGADDSNNTATGPLARALGLFEGYLVHHRESYWGHYRAASASFALGRFDQAADHLRHCLARWPNNSALHLGLSACLAELGQFDDALSECDLAQAGTPDYPEVYGSRAFVRASSGELAGLSEDIQRFEMLSGRLPSEYWRTGRSLGEARPPEGGSRPTLVPGLDDLTRSTFRHDPSDLHRGRPDTDPDDIHFRGELATRILRSGEQDLAAAEYTKILVLEPGDIPARINRALWEVEHQRFPEAAQDFNAIFQHPGLIGHLRHDPELINSLLNASRVYLSHGKLDESRDLARRSLDLAIAIHARRGNCHLALARAYAVTAKSRPEFLGRAVKQLEYAFQANPDFYQRAYSRDAAFDPVRGPIDVLLKSRCNHPTRSPKPGSRSLAQTR